MFDVQVISPTQQGPVTLKTQTIAWEKGVSEGVLEVKHIEMQQPVALLSAKTRLSGTLDAKPVFSSHVATTDQLEDTLRIKSPFTVYDGILHGFDLITAAVTLDAPMLLPNATALAGAVVLGPGVGTAAGAKLGGLVEGLLGNGRKR
jgi:hypothetical protein